MRAWEEHTNPRLVAVKRIVQGPEGVPSTLEQNTLGTLNQGKKPEGWEEECKDVCEGENVVRFW